MRWHFEGKNCSFVLTLGQIVHYEHTSLRACSALDRIVKDILYPQNCMLSQDM
jgi:hypothetical protein